MCVSAYIYKIIIHSESLHSLHLWLTSTDYFELVSTHVLRISLPIIANEPGAPTEGLSRLLANTVLLDLPLIVSFPDLVCTMRVPINLPIRMYTFCNHHRKSLEFNQFLFAVKALTLLVLGRTSYSIISSLRLQSLTVLYSECTI